MYDLSGMRFGRLCVLNRTDQKQKGSYIIWKCLYDCGNIAFVSSQNLRNGKTKSCGCYRKEVTSAHSKSRTQHGQSGSRLYMTWADMKRRCNDPSRHNYKDYGGRGISVCEQWSRCFEEFYNWSLSHGYASGLTLDRIDVNGNYEPGNCRWVTPLQQGSNKRNNHILTASNGESHTIAEWARICGVDRKTIYQRINSLGWSIDKAVTEPSRFKIA